MKALALLLITGCIFQPCGIKVTDGFITPEKNGAYAVTAPETRGVLVGSEGNTADLEFSYWGHTADVSHLADSTVRTQVGLKLEAQDICNLVYVMWEEDGTLVLSQKLNPNQSTSEECIDHGYTSMTHTHIAPLLPGVHHRLHATIVGTTLTVDADGTTIVGTIPHTLVGPIGFRTDNAVITFTLRDQ